MNVYYMCNQVNNECVLYAHVYLIFSINTNWENPPETYKGIRS